MQTLNLMTRRKLNTQVLSSLKYRWRRAATLLETSIVLLILTFSLGVGAVIYYNYLENQTNQIAAEEMRLVSSAFGKYLDDNYGAVLDETKAAGNRFTVPFQRLKDGAYLYESFENVNPYGQRYELITRYIPPIGNQSERLESVVYTSGGEIIPSKNAHAIAQMVGAGGGYTPEKGNTSRVNSTFDGYELDMQISYGVNPGAGKLVSAMFFDDAGAIVSDFLYRNAVPNRPELNTMNTHINMGNNNIDNANHITTVSADVNEHLNAGTAKVSGTLSAGGDQLGSNNFTVHGTSRLEGRVGIGGESQAGQALNVHGNTRVDGILRVTGNTQVDGNVYSNWFVSNGRTGWRNETYGGGWYMNDTTWLRAYNNKSVYTTGEIYGGTLRSINDVIAGRNVTAANDIRATNKLVSGGRTEVGEFIHLQRVVTENTSCPTTGLLARNSAGLLLSCQSGRWKKPQLIEQPIRRAGTPSVYGSVASCLSSEVMTGGGGYCGGGDIAYIHYSGPWTATSWMVDCYGTDDVDRVAYSYAMCMPK